MNRHSPALTPARPLRKPARRSSIVPRTTGADSGGPAEQDRTLKRGLVLGLHGVTDQVTQARVDAVGGSAAVQVREHRVAFGVHRREQLRADGQRLVIERDPAVVLQVELSKSVEDHHRRHCGARRTIRPAQGENPAGDRRRPKQNVNLTLPPWCEKFG
jgi:hypothetical protein